MPPPVKVNFVYSFQRVLVQRWIGDWVLKGVLLITLRYCSMCFCFKNNSGRNITITNLKLPAVVFISVWPIQSQAKQNSRIHGIDDHQALQILEELLSVDNSWGKEIMFFFENVAARKWHTFYWMTSHKCTYKQYSLDFMG